MREIDISSEQFLAVILEYDELSREEIVYNVTSLLEPLGMSLKAQKVWLSELSGSSYDTVNSWFAPGRESKIPLVVLAKISKELQISFSKILVHPEIVKELRKRSERQNYKLIVAECYFEHAEYSVAKMAEELSIAENTVRRHMHYFQKVGLRENVNEINSLIEPLFILTKNGVYELSFDNWHRAFVENRKAYSLEFKDIVQKLLQLTINKYAFSDDLELCCQENVNYCYSSSLTSISCFAIKLKRNMLSFMQVSQTIEEKTIGNIESSHYNNAVNEVESNMQKTEEYQGVRLEGAGAAKRKRGR